jgi:hypothetical protein
MRSAQVIFNETKRCLVRTGDFSESCDYVDNWGVWFGGTVLVGCGGDPWVVGGSGVRFGAPSGALWRVAVFGTTLPVVNVWEMFLVHWCDMQQGKACWDYLRWVSLWDGDVGKAGVCIWWSGLFRWGAHVAAPSEVCCAVFCVRFASSLCVGAWRTGPPWRRGRVGERVCVCVCVSVNEWWVGLCWVDIPINKVLHFIRGVGLIKG